MISFQYKARVPEGLFANTCFNFFTSSRIATDLYLISKVTLFTFVHISWSVVVVSGGGGQWWWWWWFWVENVIDCDVMLIQFECSIRWEIRRSTSSLQVDSNEQRIELQWNRNAQPVKLHWSRLRIVCCWFVNEATTKTKPRPRKYDDVVENNDDQDCNGD